MITSAAAAEFDLGLRYLRNRSVNEALKAFERAETLGYGARQCCAERWNCWMLLGEFERAWRESELIAAMGASDAHALWDGMPFEGKRLLIRCLHGYGDAIQFLRYADLLHGTASTVIVETHPEMVDLVRCVRGVDEVVTWSDGAIPRERWDQQIEVTELPRACRTTVSTIPARVPYIQISQEARDRSLRLLGASNELRVGLVWASSSWNPARCMAFQNLAQLLECRRCKFYSFQRDPERCELPSGIHDTAVHSPGIADTAADLTHMDLLISADTMAAHLAGALARPVWTLLPFEADWRWMAQGDTTPWYPTMRLFRQPAPGEWDPAIAQAAAELTRLTAPR